MKTIDLTPSWKAAVRIYITVLENPDAGEDGKQAAREDLMRLADSMDKANEGKKNEK